MAMPIIISSRIVKEDGNKSLVAFSNFALNDSGFMVECEYDDKFEIPWGVKLMEIRDKGDFSLFGMMIKSFIVDGIASTFEQRRRDAEQKFANLVSAEISTMLNGFHGISDTKKPIPISPEDFAEQISEEVFTFGSRSTDAAGQSEFELVPMKIKMKALYSTPLVDLDFFKDLPPHILNPEAGITK